MRQSLNWIQTPLNVNIIQQKTRGRILMTFEQRTDYTPSVGNSLAT